MQAYGKISNMAFNMNDQINEMVESVQEDAIEHAYIQLQARGVMMSEPGFQDVADVVEDDLLKYLLNELQMVNGTRYQTNSFEGFLSGLVRDKIISLTQATESLVVKAAIRMKKEG